jgi:hypothetical protein
MGKKVDVTHVVKFDDTNYQRWKLQMTLVLKAAELWDVVSGATPCPALATDKPAWEKKDVEAQAIMVPTLGIAQTNHVYNCTTSKEMFDRLKDVNSDSSSLNKQHTLSSFLNYKVTQGQSVIAAYMEVEQLARSLNEMGVAMDETTVITKIVSSLPDAQFNAFKKAWDSVPEATQSMTMLLARLRKEELERKQAEKSNPAPSKPPAAFSSDSRPKGKKPSLEELKKKSNCNNCGKRGHWARECRSAKKIPAPGGPTHSSQQKVQGNPAGAFMVRGAYQHGYEFVWISDSGATQHITGTKDWFEAFEEFDVPRPVSLTDNNKAQALGIGRVRMDAFMQEEWREVTISNVLYIPGAVNLFSESVMAQKGYVVIRDKTRTVFYEDGSIPGPEADYKDNMYVMKFRPLRQSALSTRVNMAELWHARLSHINMKYVRATVEKEAVTGIDLNDLVGDFQCVECHLGKETRKPFPPSQRAKTVPGEKIHADLSGKMPTKSLGGSLYFLLLKDDSTGFRKVYFLKRKDETPDCIKEFIPFMEKQTGNKVKTLKTDNGTEFVNVVLSSYLLEAGIVHETTAPYCPESNGRVEREMRTLKDTARAMLQKYQTPEFLWAEAIATTVYVHNRVLDKQSPDVTAFEQVFGRKPALDHLRVFGCRAFAQVPKEKRLVWDAKAEPHVFVGYDSNSKKYRLHHEASRTILIARNVSFHEPAPEQYITVQISPPEPLVPDHPGEDDPEDSDSDDSNHSDSDDQKEAEADVEEDAETEGLADDGEGTAVVQRATGSQSDNMELLVTMADGNQYRAVIPSQGSSTVVLPKIPKPSVSSTGPTLRKVVVPPPLPPATLSPTGPTLRDRSKLRHPDRFQPRANLARLDDEPDCYDDAVSSPDSHEWALAMEEEMGSHRKNETWTLVERPPKVKVLDSRWVFKVKRLQDGSVERYKARLVIKGYKQRPGVDFNETFASVARYESIRLLLALAAAHRLKIKQFDIKTAFLYGNLEETIYMAEPEGFAVSDGSKVCLLKKSLYGLKQSPRCWNHTFSEFLTKFKFRPTASDSCVYVGSWLNTAVYLTIYVDDGLILSSNEDIIQTVLATIESKFELKSGEATTYVGLEITQMRGEILLTQNAYINSVLETFNMTDCKPTSVPMQPNQELIPATVCDDHLPYRELIGCLIFLARSTRPDIAYATSKLAQFVTYHDETHWKAAKSILRYLRGTTNLGLRYLAGTDVTLTGYTDSDYAADKIERKSTSGFAFLLNQSLITWSSQKQPVVALSSTEAEYVALAAGAKEAVWLRQFCAELGFEQKAPTRILVDNQSSIKLANNPEFHNRSKHIDVRYHFTRTLVEEKKIDLAFVPTTEQLADGLTKPLLKTKHENMRTNMGMVVKGAVPVLTKKPGALWTATTLLLTLCLFLGSGDGFTTQNSQPVLWRPSKVPVTTGHNRVHLRVILINPCEILTSEVLHMDVAKMARDRCDEMYSQLFLDEIEKLCPLEHDRRDILSRHKRFLFTLLIGLIIATVVIPVGLGVAAVTVSSVNAGKITEVNKAIALDRKATQALANRTDMLEVAVKKLQLNFNSLLDKLEAHERDFTQLKYKQIGTNFAVSYVTARLLTGKQIVQEAVRQWADGKVYPALLDYLNFTLPCGDDCPVTLATPNKCSMNQDRTELFFDFNVPLINRTLKLVESDPFELMLKEKNKTCTIVYTGPRNVILSTEKDCAFAVNVKQPVKPMILSSLHPMDVWPTPKFLRPLNILR